MKKMLRFEKNETWYFVDGKRIFGLPSGLRGDVSGLTGDVSGLTGNVTGLRGNVSGLTGDVTGLTGNVTGLRGNVTVCEISTEEREKTIDVSKLISEE
jgi:ribosomal protein L21E